MPNPHCEEAAQWTAALESYHKDLVEEAWRAIEPHGLGEAGANIRWYRLIEAEALLRSRSGTRRVNDWLSLESVTSETLGTEDRITEVAIEASDRVAQRFGWRHEAQVLLSILCRESEAPWATNPNGYWVNKDPYDKICLPYYLLEDETELAQAIAHEYAHVVCAGLTDEQAPTWLHEAVSVSSEGFEPIESARSTVKVWKAPDALERTLEHENPENPDEVFMAYQQCGWIAAYLGSLSRDGKLVAFLREHANESFGANILRLLKGEDRVDRALRVCYGMSVRDLFARAERFMTERSS